MHCTQRPRNDDYARNSGWRESGCRRRRNRCWCRNWHWGCQNWHRRRNRHWNWCSNRRNN